MKKPDWIHLAYPISNLGYMQEVNLRLNTDAGASQNSVNPELGEVLTALTLFNQGNRTIRPIDTNGVYQGDQL